MTENLGDRMKDFYEDRTRFKLARRTNTISGLRLWKKEQLNFIVRFNTNTWSLAIHDVLKYGTNQLVQDKKEFYNAIKTYDICVASLEETVHTSPHTEKIVR